MPFATSFFVSYHQIVDENKLGANHFYACASIFIPADLSGPASLTAFTYLIFIPSDVETTVDPKWAGQLRGKLKGRILKELLQRTRSYIDQ